MTITVRPLTAEDWPMLRDMGVNDEPVEVHRGRCGGDDHRTARLHDLYVHPDARRSGVGRALMTAVRRWAEPRVRHLEWQAHHERAAPFYERLGHRGDPCPQPDYPTFILDLPRPRG